MKKIIANLMFLFVLSGCSDQLLKKQEPVCEATAMLGGLPRTVQIYGVRVVAHQVEYKAGDPFNWRWVNKNNFTSSTCK